MTVHNERDQLEAMINHLQRRIEEMEQESKAIARDAQSRITTAKDVLRTIIDARNGWDKLNSGGPVTKGPDNDADLPISESIDRFLSETGKTELTAADVKHYMINLGYEIDNSTYNTIHQTLKRLAKANKLIHIKEEKKFKVPPC